MNFTEAMKELREGKKIRRAAWEPTLHLRTVIVKQEGETENHIIQSYRQEMSVFQWNLSTLQSTDWIVSDSNEEVSFELAVEAIQKGKTARLKHWEDSYIANDKTSNQIVFIHYAPYPFTPSFQCLKSQDWSVYES